MAERTILVFGATGKQGGAVVDALLAAPAGSPRFRLRTITRDPSSAKARKLTERGVEVLKGDMTDAESVKAALNGVWGVFLVTDSYGKGGLEAEVKQGFTVVDAASNAGVQYFVFSSVGGLSTVLGREVPHFATKLQVEERLKSKVWASGYAIIRPVAFMENVEIFGPLTLGKFSTIMPAKTKVQHISTKDIGEFGALAFLKPELFKGKETEIAGDDISGEDTARILGELTGTKWSYSKMIPMWLLRFLMWDAYKMLVFFEQDGYKADIPALRAIKPDLQDFRAWAKAKGIGNVAQGANTYKFAPPSRMGLYVTAAVGVAVAVSVGWWFTKE